MRNWRGCLLVCGAFLFLLLAFLLFMIADFDLPCQDGRWDKEQHTCIPDQAL